MLRKKINDDWQFAKGSVSLMNLFVAEEGKVQKVNLPHDAMIYEERDKQTKNSSHTGFYPGNTYTYFKQLDVPSDWQDKQIVLEFEGVSNFPKIYINGDYAGGSMNAYANFYVVANSYLKYGESNEIKVEVNNMEQTSRWYPGGGIYRNVNLLVGESVHLKVDGLQITTPEVSQDYATIQVKTVLENIGLIMKKVEVKVEILDEQQHVIKTSVIPVTADGREENTSYHRIALKDPKLWDAENPNLYTCHVTVLQNDKIIDTEIVNFGIRTLQLSAETGLRVNSKEVKLRGTCLHHDNGIIGATTLEAAEERRCRQLKEAGFNCIRSSHHPLSKAMLQACDKIGMYVIDELTDIWTRSKNPNDYGAFFPHHWERDVQNMVAKDFNHPCVIMYSTGNEIQESGTPKGAKLNREISAKFKSLDSARYTTNGINGLVAASEKLGEILSDITGMSTEEMMGSAKNASEEQKSASIVNLDESDGANEWNGMMSMMMGPIADGFATHPILRELLDEFTSANDIAGYNYLTALHEAEKETHPNRVVLGTETFPADIVHLWDVVKKNSHVIGDMTWIGYDYIGEAGCGIFYYDGTQNFSPNWPDRLAYIGDIDLIGNRRPISYLREIVYGLRKKPYIAVKRMNRNEQISSITPWMWKDNIASWTWDGYEEKTASIDVYGNGDEVELFLNGTSLGKKDITETFCGTFEVPYQPGELTAVSYQADKEVSRFRLHTAGADVELQTQVDQSELEANGASLAYVNIQLVDRKGVWNPQFQKKVSIRVEGQGTVQGFGSADPQALPSYQDLTWPTYDGQLLAAIRSTKEAGEIKVTISAEGCQTKIITIKTK